MFIRSTCPAPQLVLALLVLFYSVVSGSKYHKSKLHGPGSDKSDTGIVVTGDAPSPRTKATAARLVEHWKRDRIQPQHAFHLQSFDADILTQANSFIQWLTPCFYLLRFSAASQRLEVVTYLKRVNIKNIHCSMFYDEWVDKYVVWFQQAISAPWNSGSLTHDFQFMMDVSDAHMPNSKLIFQEHFGVPLLVLSLSPNDKHSIPFLEFFMVEGYLYDNNYNVNNHHNLSDEYIGRYVDVYSHSFEHTPWELKKPEAVYRGASYATYGLTEGGPAFTSTRAELCVMHEDLAARRRSPANPDGELLPPIDIGTINDWICKLKEDQPYPEICKMCRPCSKGRRLSPQQMISQYRYQILADGGGASFDSAIWKLASGSVTFLIQPLSPNTSTPLSTWQLWWYPLFTPGKHYILTTAAGLPGAVARCVARPDGCRGMGEAARSVMLGSVTRSMAQHYTHLVLQHVHDMFDDDSAKAPQPVYQIARAPSN